MTWPFRFLFFIFLCSTSQARAFDLFINSSKYHSMAGAGLANTDRYGLEDFALINPAVASARADLNFSGGYAMGERQGMDIEAFAVSILDSVSGAFDSKQSSLKDMGGAFPIASVFNYSYLDYKQFRDQYFHLALSQPLTQKLSVGLYGNYSILTGHMISASEKVFDFGAGALWKVHKKITLAVSALNLLDRRHEIIAGYLRSSYGLGLELKATSKVKIHGDIWRSKDENGENKGIWKIGASNQVTDGFLLRFGYGDDRLLDTHIIAAGFAILGPRLTLGYSFQRQTSLDSVLHSVDFRLPFW